MTSPFIIFGFVVGTLVAGHWSGGLIGLIVFGVLAYFITGGMDPDHIPEGMGAHGDHTSDQGF